MADSSIKQKTGRYAQGGSTDVYSNRLGWWERTEIPRSGDDINITINARHALRPDLIAYDIYGDARLAWLVLQYNNIVDINTELDKGVVINVPSPQRALYSLISNPFNGNFIT